MVAIHGDHAADFAGVQAHERAGREHRDLREQRLHERRRERLVLGAHDLADRLVRPEPRPRSRRHRQPGVGVDQTEDLRVLTDGGAVQALREALSLLALVVLEHRLDEAFARGRPAANQLDREPRMRAVDRLLVGRQRVEPSEQSLGSLPESDVDQAAGHAELDPTRAVVADARADRHREHGDARLVERQVVDAGQRRRVVGHPKELARPLQRDRAAIDDLLVLRPRKRVPRADQLADAGEEELELGKERLHALRRRLVHDRQRVEARSRLDGAWLLGGGRRRRGTRRLHHRAWTWRGWRRRWWRRRGRRRRVLGGVRGLLADDAAHDVAHTHHQATPTMSLITSATIFSPISFTRLEYPTRRATSQRLLISRGVPRVKSKTSLIASSVKS